MRKLKNTLYVSTPEAYIAREGNDLLVCLPEGKKVRVPVINLEAVVQFGYPGASPAALALCMEHGVCVSFLQPGGRFLARVEGPVSGSVLLRKKQYRASDENKLAARIASRFVAAKILNGRTVLNRGMRDHPDRIDGEKMGQTSAILRRLAERAFEETDMDLLRGKEGEAARRYFEGFNALVLQDPEAFTMNGRTRRPPLDRMNCLLSFLYTLLTHECRSALETVGLDPQVGFLHRDRPGRPSLALDLMEELRPVTMDRLALTLVNRRQIGANDFQIQADGAVLMKDEARKLTVDAWQKRKQEELLHPFLGEKISFGLLPYAQAMLLARSLREDAGDYPAFVWR